MWMTTMLTLTTIIIIMKLMSTIMKKKIPNKINKHPFECGFSKTSNNKNTPFSIQFFMLSIMFIIFDVEISILISMVKPLNSWTIKEWGKTTSIFMMTMILGILYEWKESAMYWMK